MLLLLFCLLKFFFLLMGVPKTSTQNIINCCEKVVSPNIAKLGNNSVFRKENPPEKD